MIPSDALSEALHNEDPLGRRFGQAAAAALFALPFAWLGVAVTDQTCYGQATLAQGAPTPGTAADRFCQAVVPGHPSPEFDWQVVGVGVVAAIAGGVMLLPVNRALRVMLVATLALTVAAAGVLSAFLNNFTPGG